MTTLDVLHVYHEDGTIDPRYTVTWEYTGLDVRHAVARFNKHWIGESETEGEAWQLARKAAKKARGVND